MRAKKTAITYTFKNVWLGAGIVIGVFFVYLLLAPSPVYKTGFRTLPEIQAYAQQKLETVKIDTDNTLRPVFDTFYQQYVPTFFSKIKDKFYKLLSLISLVKEPAFSPSFFKTLVINLGNERDKISGDVITKIITTENSKLVVFGNLYSAFHSLVRDLGELKNLGIIDDTLKIIKPDYYIVFMGNVVSRSCYSMETMAIAMRLLEANKDKFIYLRGNHESKNYWQEHTLKRELQIRAVDLSEQTLPLEKEVNKFFNTLPLALYLSVPGSETDFVRISHLGRRQSIMLREHNFAKFLMAKGEAFSSYIIPEVVDSEDVQSPVRIRAIIRGEKKRVSFQKMEGLRYLAPDLDSVAWNILSCPTYVFQKALEFYYDAFVTLSVASDIDRWTLTLHRRDIRTQDAFKTISYYLLSGINTQTKKVLARNQAKPSEKDLKIAQEAQREQVRKEPVAPVQELVVPEPVVPEPVVPEPVVPEVPAQEVPAQDLESKTEKLPEQKISEKKLPDISRALIQQYVIEKILTAEQWQKIYKQILTPEQRVKVDKKLSKVTEPVITQEVLEPVVSEQSDIQEDLVSPEVPEVSVQPMIFEPQGASLE
ncbi:MAG: metallophosphoesterase [bacterium]